MRLLPVLLFVLLFDLLLAGCASIARVEHGSFTVGEALEVTSDGRWNRIDPPGSETDADEAWTAEGVTLDMIVFYVGIEDGAPLGRGAGPQAPVFRAGMLPHDVLELYEANVAQDGAAVRVERLAPARFGGVDGFLFEHTTMPRSGAALRGRVYGAVVDARLYLMSYSAPEAYFYAKHLPAVEALAATARIRRRESAASASP
jgi:hypothetical protein